MTYHYNGQIVEAPWKPIIFRGHYGIMWYQSKLGLRCADLEDWEAKARPVTPGAAELAPPRPFRDLVNARAEARRDARRKAKEAAE